MGDRTEPGIVILLESYPPIVGGTPSHAHLLAGDLARRGMRVLVVTRRWDARVPAREVADGVTVLRIGPAGYGSGKKWRMLLACLPVLVRLRREYDLLYVPGLRVLGVAGVLVARLFGKRCVLRAVSCGEMSGAFFESGLRRRRIPGLRLLVRAVLQLRNSLLRRADAFVAVSSETEREMLACGVASSKVRRIPNGVDTRRFCPVSAARKAELRAAFSIPAAARVVTYTGRLVRYKGLPGLLRAWRELDREVPGALLLLVGAGGNDMDNCERELREFCAEHGLQGSVRFVGDVTGVEQYLQASDVFVFPTENEAFGISLIEAMACGLPVISTGVGGTRDIVQHEANGLEFKPGAVAELQAVLLRLLKEPAVAERLGRAALESARTRYSRESVAQSYADLFRELLPASRP